MILTPDYFEILDAHRLSKMKQSDGSTELGPP